MSASATTDVKIDDHEPTLRGSYRANFPSSRVGLLMMMMMNSVVLVGWYWLQCECLVREIMILSYDVCDLLPAFVSETELVTVTEWSRLVLY